MVQTCVSEGGLCAQKPPACKSPATRSAPVVSEWGGVSAKEAAGRAQLAVLQKVRLSEATGLCVSPSNCSRTGPTFGGHG